MHVPNFAGDNTISNVKDWCEKSELFTDSEYVLALTGSRSCGYSTEASDYDFEILCPSNAYKRICRHFGRDAAVRGVMIDKNIHAIKSKKEIDFTVHELPYIENALLSWNDEPLWIWHRAVPLYDPGGWVESIHSKTKEYPADVLQDKIKKHFLRDFHISVHGITYNQNSENKFSVIHALSVKVAEYCRLCCLIDGNPYPYEKWLLRACYESSSGDDIAPILEEVINAISEIPGPSSKNWHRIKTAVEMIDTKACDILEEKLVRVGISKEWIKESYYLLEEEIYS